MLPIYYVWSNFYSLKKALMDLLIRNSQWIREIIIEIETTVFHNCTIFTHEEFARMFL